MPQSNARRICDADFAIERYSRAVSWKFACEFAGLFRAWRRGTASPWAQWASSERLAGHEQSSATSSKNYQGTTLARLSRRVAFDPGVSDELEGALQGLCRLHGVTRIHA
jgi:hypothetical protein